MNTPYASSRIGCWLRTLALVVLVASGGVACGVLPRTAPDDIQLRAEARAIDDLRMGRYELLRRVADLPADIVVPPGALDRLADFDRPYQVTDLRDQPLPRTQLLAAAVTQDAVFLFVRHGGYVTRTDTIVVGRHGARFWCERHGAPRPVSLERSAWPFNQAQPASEVKRELTRDTWAHDFRRRDPCLLRS